MRNNRCKKTLTTILAFGLVVSQLLGCAAKETVQIDAMEAEKADAVSFDIIGGEDVMPIGAFYGPYVCGYSEDGQSAPNYMEEYYWQAMADCGINVMLQTQLDYAMSPSLVQDTLDMGEKYNIGICVTDNAVRTMGEDGSEIDIEKLSTRLSEYVTHPAFAGVYLQDEPYTSEFEPVASQPERNLYIRENVAKALHNDIDTFTYVNLLSSGLEKESFPIYEEYVRECVETLEPKYLLYDRYVFDASQKDYVDRYFYDLAIVRKVSHENSIPFWTFIQCGSQWNDAQEQFDSDGYYPLEGQFDWNVNTSLAFGAKGFSYFMFIQPYYFAYAKSEPFDFERNGLIGAWGNKNRWWYYAQDISKQIRAVDEVLMNSVNKGVLACGEQVTKDMKLTEDYDVLLEGTSWRELKSVDGDALVGCFNYQGKTALYVVNYDTEYAQKINLEFQDSYQVRVVQDGETRNVKGDGMTLDLLAGGAALLVFE